MALLSNHGRRIAGIALLVYVLDQLSKYFVLRLLGQGAITPRWRSWR